MRKIIFLPISLQMIFLFQKCIGFNIVSKEEDEFYLELCRIVWDS